jgi:hypothetical protein
MRIALCAALAVAGLAAAPAAQAQPEPLTAEEDHARLLGLLGIEALRPGRNGSDPSHPNYAAVGLTGGELAWRQHLGGHANEPNWESFPEFAARTFEAE